MGNKEDTIKETLLGFERLLLLNSVRTDSRQISELLDDHFKEFTSSGKIYRYRNDDTFNESKDEIIINDSSVELVNLSDDVKLLLYQAIKQNDGIEIKSNRSSVWKKVDAKWKLIFHQGTISSE